MRHVIVLAIVSACVASADPPTLLPDLVLERGEVLAYAYPPYDSLVTSDPRVVRIVERGKGHVELVGTAAGFVDVKLVATESGRAVRYLGRIAVLMPLADAITAEIRALHQDRSPAEQQRAAAELLARARGLYRDRAHAAVNLYRSYELARQAWSLLEVHGATSATRIDAADLMEKSQVELDAKFQEASVDLHRVIAARDWAAVAARTGALLQLLPDPRDGRHQRVLKLRDFYADVLLARSARPDRVPADEARFHELLRKGREEFEEGNFEAARQFYALIPDTSIYHQYASAALEIIVLESNKRESQKYYQLGEGEKVLALLRGATEPSLVAFREKVDSVHQIFRQAKELYAVGKFAQANEMWAVLKRMVGDPTNQYYKWAEAGIKVDPTPTPPEYAKEAQEAFAAGRFLDAARLTARALDHDPRNPEALKLRGTIERQVNLHYAIFRQIWSEKPTDAEVVAFVTEQYVLLRALNATHPLLAQMANVIEKAGGKVPPSESVGDPNK